MNDLPSGDYVFKYIDRDDIERVRQRILQRRKFELLNNVRACEMQIQRKAINCSVECELIEKCPSRQRETENENVIKNDPTKSLDLERADEQRTPDENKSKPFQQSSVDRSTENRSKRSKNIYRRSNQPRSNSTKIVVQSSAESIETNNNTLIRLTFFQQAIDVKLDEIIPALTNFKNCDGSLEVQKFERRFADHLKVFSRNYLYQIECIISEIQQPLTYNDFTTKVFSLYELIHHGLNAFVKSLNHFVGTKVPDKLPKLLSCIEQATKLCVQFDFFDQQDSIVVSLLAKVNRIMIQIKGIEVIRRKKADRCEPQRAMPIIKLRGRLSMYGSEKQVKMTKRKCNDRCKSKTDRASIPSQSTGPSEVLVEKTSIPI